MGEVVDLKPYLPKEYPTDYYYSRGLKYIYKSNAKNWKKAIEEALKTSFAGEQLSKALGIMEELETKEVKEIAEKYSYHQRDKLAQETYILVMRFSKKGPEFIRELAKALKMEISKKSRGPFTRNRN